jgi:DNA repair protein RadC
MIISEYKRMKITTPKKVAHILRALLDGEHEIDQDKEHFWVIGLDAKKCVKYIELVSLGTLDSSVVHARETYRLAVMTATASLIVAHNHPSGDSTPSPGDLAITKRLKEGGDILGIALLDHVIIGRGRKFTSLLEEGHMDCGPRLHPGE